jgi:hypothetical protein
MSFSGPARHIPAEIISEIVHYSVPYPLEPSRQWISYSNNGLQYPQSLLALSHVDTFWRQTVIANSMLWATLSCEFHESLFSVFVTRAFEHPVSIYLGASRELGELPPGSTTRVINNLNLALRIKNKVVKLSINRSSLLDELEDFTRRLPTAFAAVQNAFKFESLQEIYIHWDIQPYLDLSPILSVDILPDLRKLYIASCPLPWICLAQCSQLTSLDLSIAYDSGIDPEMWRSIMSNLSINLEYLKLDYGPGNPNDPPVRISPGNPILMTKLEEVEFNFDDCVEFAFLLNFITTASIDLQDWRWEPGAAIMFCNHYLSSVLDAWHDIRISITIEYHIEWTVLIFTAGSAEVRYQIGERSILPEDLLSALSYQVRMSAIELHLWRCPDLTDGDLFGYDELSDLLPHIALLELETYDKADEVIITEFYNNQNREGPRAPSFPNLSVVCFVTQMELDRDPGGLATAVQRRAERGQPFKLIRLDKHCSISRACLAKIMEVRPACLVISEDQYSAVQNRDPNWYMAPSFQIIENLPEQIAISL